MIEAIPYDTLGLTSHIVYIVEVKTKRKICEILSKEIFSLKRFFVPKGTFLAVWEHSPLKKTSHTAKNYLWGTKNLLREKISFERITDLAFCFDLNNIRPVLMYTGIPPNKNWICEILDFDP